MNKVVFGVLFLMLTSCAYYSPIYWGWGEWTGQEVSGLDGSSVALFDWSKLPGTIIIIDGDSVGNGYKKAKLLPGRHLIGYAYYPVEFGVHPKGIIDMNLKANHLYEFRIKLCYSCNPRRYNILVKDRSTGEIVWNEINGIRND